MKYLTLAEILQQAFGAARAAATEVIRKKNRLLGSAGKIAHYGVKP